MEKLKTQEVYTVEELEKIASDFAEDHSETIRNVFEYNTANDVAKGFVAGVIYQQLKNVDTYTLSKDEIIKLVGDAFQAGWNCGHADGAEIDKYTNYPDKQTYIENLHRKPL